MYLIFKSALSGKFVRVNDNADTSGSTATPSERCVPEYLEVDLGQT